MISDSGLPERCARRHSCSRVWSSLRRLASPVSGSVVASASSWRSARWRKCNSRPSNQVSISRAPHNNSVPIPTKMALRLQALNTSSVASETTTIKGRSPTSEKLYSRSSSSMLERAIKLPLCSCRKRINTGLLLRLVCASAASGSGCWVSGVPSVLISRIKPWGSRTSRWNRVLK